MRRPNVDAIKQLLQETLKDLTGVEIWPSGDVDCLTVALSVNSPRGPVLDLDDLKRIAEALLKTSLRDYERDLRFLLYPSVVTGDWLQLSIQIETQDLRDDLLEEFEANV